MNKIEGELFTPYQKEVSYSEVSFTDKTFFIKTRTEWDKFGGTVNKVRSSEGYPVENFRDLINQVALVTLNNSRFEMFYRGQTKDHLNNQAEFYKDRKSKSTVLPAICRPGKKVDGTVKYSIRKTEVLRRYNELYGLIEFINSQKKVSAPEVYYMSLFQHYDILPTPLIDITQSLRVAATFALRKNQRGYVYVFGLPFPNQSVSYFTDMGIVLLKLQNVVSVEAVRPRYQEGYLVGKFPFAKSKSVSDDLSNRMVAKFVVNNLNDDFWDKDFLPMPDDLLFPKNDKSEKELKEFKSKFIDSINRKSE